MRTTLLLFQADIESLRTPENAAVLLASFTYDGCVDYGKQLLDIVYQKLVKEPFISLLVQI